MLNVEQLESRLTPSSLPRNIIYIVNEQNQVSITAVHNAIEAVQIQLDRDFRKYWHRDPLLVYVSGITPIPDSAWRVYLHISDTTVPGALGYHSILNRTPYASIPMDVNIEGGYDWVITLSHEVLEMVADPTVIRVFSMYIRDPDTKKLIHVKMEVEVCDPIEDNSYTIRIHTGEDINVSDFVTPAWFRRQKGPVDFLHVLSKPATIGLNGFFTYITDNGNSVEYPKL